MRVAFLGGGTGGHLAPGIGVAQVLARTGGECLFLVAGREVERAMLAPRGLPLRALFGDVSRPHLLQVSAWWRATQRLRSAVSSFDPDVVVVLGGWVALPALWTGFAGRPTVLVESNARPGRVGRLLGGRVDHACLAVDGADMPRGRRGTHVTGAPLPELALPELERAAADLGLDPVRRTLLLFGGSQGARDLDELLEPLRQVLAQQPDAWQILHVAGANPRSAEVVFPGAVPVVRHGFLADMSPAWAASDVAVCRAGAGTVAELAATGTPSVLVPYPHHADRHQAANGARLVEVGGALMVGPEDPRGRSAPGLLSRCLPRLGEMAAAARRAAQPEATGAVATVVREAGRWRQPWRVRT